MNRLKRFFICCVLLISLFDIEVDAKGGRGGGRSRFRSSGGGGGGAIAGGTIGWIVFGSIAGAIIIGVIFYILYRKCRS